ncbi:MAG TPA: hypothetical protein PK280_03105 [Planctomycetota bacterium]|nr:hypothetical protein [Planctomycetota bacterium]
MITTKTKSAPAWTRRSPATRPGAEPMAIRGHWLLCAVCARGGCRTPPPGRVAIDRLLKFMWAYPFAPLRVLGDVDVARAHYLHAYEGRSSRDLPEGFAARSADHAWRRKDLEVCRVLGIVPGTEITAYHAYATLFARQPTLEGICRTGSRPSTDWPECPHARRGCYEKIAGEPRANLHRQYELGEKLAGRGLWAMVRPRSRRDMHGAKRRSARFILEEAERLYIRPSHCLCILCNTVDDPGREPLAEDNLVELFRRMTREPEVPVTLSEGCCMVCDACNVYHAGEHLCYHAHIKSSLRDLMVLERLGLPPGATLPARELYRRIYERIGGLKEICGWRDGSSTAHLWAPCNFDRPVLADARRKGLITGRPVRHVGSRA